MSSTKCLLVIDVQTAMFNLPRPLFNAQGVLENIRGLIDKARSGRAPVIFLRHGGGEGSPFATGSAGWKIHPAVPPAGDEPVIEKHHADSFQDTELEATLKELSVDRVVLCGLVTEGCLDTTTRRASSLGYEVEVASDCHSTTDSNVLTGEQIVAHHNEVLRIFAEVKPAAAISFGP